MKHLKSTMFSILCSLLLLLTSCGGQKQKLREADRNYKNLSYIKTSEILEEVASEGYKSVDMLQKLGNSYYFNDNMKSASKWYGELMTKAETEKVTIDPEYYFRYAQSLKSQERYTESDKWIKRFYQEKSNDSRAKAYMSETDYLKVIENESRQLDLVNLKLNTPFSDFGSTRYRENYLLFSSSRNENSNKYEWNDKPFLRFYTAKKANAQDSSAYRKIRLFGVPQEKNLRYHESSGAFTPDGETFYFTRNFLKDKVKPGTKILNGLQLFKRNFNPFTGWSKAESVSLNSKDYNTAHPTINAAGNKLIFSSDMSGSLGNSDLFIVNIAEDGTLDTPVNLGDAINTEGQENFPFINENGDLYFSSDRLTGLGGLDVYVVKDFEYRYKTGQQLIVKNAGRPINSPQDDFSYSESLKAAEGFFSSNRPGGKGDDDIYKFEIPECKQVVKGVVLDKDTQKPIAGSTVTLYNRSGKSYDQFDVSEDGSFEFYMDCDSEFLIRAEKNKYATSEERFVSTSKMQEVKNVELYLKSNEVELEVGDDLIKVLEIPTIYFDSDRYVIREDAEIGLQTILAVMKNYPTMTIEIRSHTDCTAPAAYNMELSENRAKATMFYLISKGIKADRLTSRGFGESQPINKCNCKKYTCSKEDLQENRRSEFILTRI